LALVAVIDANVLWSAPLRDTLLSAAEAGLFRPVWTDQILDEVARTLKERRPDLDARRIDRTIKIIREEFPEALISGYEPLIPAMTNDEGDRHVLAAAVRSGSTVLITWNTSDFPASACEPYGIEIQSPDEFLVELWDSDPDRLLGVLEEQAARLQRPPQTTDQLLATLKRLLPDFVRAVEAHRG
jgi:predicted nucleic acid-binding protein